MSSGASYKRLRRQLDESLDEVARLKLLYERGIERLERALRQDLPPAGAAQWFAMFLRVADVGVQIRRGEVRHRSARQVRHACMHTTGIKGATHSGLSIDDANAIFQALVDRKAISSLTEDAYFSKLESLDTTDVQALDERLTATRERFQALKSAFYSRLEVSGSDPYQSLEVVSDGQVVARAARECRSPSTCTCEEDAEPWETFVIDVDVNAGARAQPAPDANREDSGADVGLLDIKRQFGYVEQDAGSVDPQALAHDVSELKRRTQSGLSGAVAEAKARAANRPAPAQVYSTRCAENGVQPKPAVLHTLSVRNGSMQLDLSPVGFQSADDLHDIAHIVSKVAAYVTVEELNVSNGFFNGRAFAALCKLVQLPSVATAVRKVGLRGLSLPRRDDLAKLLQLLQVNGEVRELDISFDTLSPASARCLEPLFRAHPRLERLAMASCFPDSSAMDPASHADVIVAVRAAFLSCCGGASLKAVRLDSNWVHHSWLSALLSPDSCVQELRLSNVSFVALPEDEDVDMAGDRDATWGLHFDHLTALTVTVAPDRHSTLGTSNEHGMHALVSGLRRGFEVGFMQLKHLELAADYATVEQSVSPAFKGIVELIGQVRDYGALASLTLSLDHSIESDAKLEAVKQLVAGGLCECEALQLAVGRVRSLAALQDLVADCALPKARTVGLAVEIVQDNDSRFQSTTDEDAKQLARSVSASLSASDQWSSLSMLTMRVVLLVPASDQPLSDRMERPIDVFCHEVERMWKAGGGTTSRGCSTSKKRTSGSATGAGDRHYDRVAYSCCLTVK